MILSVSVYWAFVIVVSVLLVARGSRSVRDRGWFVWGHVGVVWRCFVIVDF